MGESDYRAMVLMEARLRGWLVRPSRGDMMGSVAGIDYRVPDEENTNVRDFKTWKAFWEFMGTKGWGRWTGVRVWDGSGSKVVPFYYES